MRQSLLPVRHTIDLGNRQLFFLHIPKTGGLTLRGLLTRYFMRHEICPVNGLGSFVRLTDEAIAHYRYFRGHLPYNAIQLMPQIPVRITFLRDPFERTLSNYAYLRSRPDLRLHSYASANDLLDYLRQPRIEHNQNDMMTFFLGANFPVRERPVREKNFELALRRLESFEFIGITERYQESIELLAHQFGLPNLPQVEKRNVTPERKRSSDLTLAEYAQIDSMTRLDQQLYARASVLFEQRYAAFARARDLNHSPQP